MNNSSADPSPRWNATTKLVVALTFVGLSLMLMIRFQNVIGPLLVAFLISYLFYPLANWFRTLTHLPWRLIVTVLYILIFAILIGSLTAGGFVLVDQVQSLIKFLEVAIKNLPQTIADFTATPLMIGPFALDIAHLDFDVLSKQVMDNVQPVLAQAGTLATSFASSAASGLGWLLFMLLISYFILSESDGIRAQMFSFRIPGHEYDVERLSTELERVWNAFLRGQLIIFALTYVVYVGLLGIFGVRFYFGLALLAGLARFVPYVGPFVAWTSYGLVAFFQGTTVFGLPAWGYVLLIVGLAYVTDMILDNFVVPRLMSDALQVHPAAVMVSALLGANLLGFIGMILAAPVLATLKLFVDYAMRKMFDLDPWSFIQPAEQPPSVSEVVERGRSRLLKIRDQIRNLFSRPSSKA